jgi:hypothetical protein
LRDRVPMLVTDLPNAAIAVANDDGALKTERASTSAFPGSGQGFIVTIHYLSVNARVPTGWRKASKYAAAK